MWIQCLKVTKWGWKLFVTTKCSWDTSRGSTWRPNNLSHIVCTNYIERKWTASAFIILRIVLSGHTVWVWNAQVSKWVASVCINAQHFLWHLKIWVVVQCFVLDFGLAEILSPLSLHTPAPEHRAWWNVQPYFGELLPKTPPIRVDSSKPLGGGSPSVSCWVATTSTPRPNHPNLGRAESTHSQISAIDTTNQ